MQLTDQTLLDALAGLVLLLCVVLLWQLGRGSRRAKRRARRAVQGEARAARLLARAGYAVEANQVGGTVQIIVDGERQTFDLRADYLVSRGGRRYVAEVKTGSKAPELSHGATRRQLLEYTMAFGVDGVLLVTPEDGRIRQVDFPGLEHRRFAMALVWMVLGAATTLAIMRLTRGM